MTENEAKTKWCPMARVAYCGTHSFAANRMWPDIALETAMCIASDCMMWNYVHPEYVTGKDVDGDLQGYCGLARKG
jgi:hypothetical protein